MRFTISVGSEFEWPHEAQTNPKVDPNGAPMIESRATGVVYRNPTPGLRSINAWHPSIIVMDDGELISTFDLAESAESLDYRTYIARSTDAGQSWTTPSPLFNDVVSRRSTHSARISRVKDGSLVAFGARAYRDDPDVGIVNHETLGFVPTDLFTLRSCDGGHTWEGPRTIDPPLIGPSFEVCHRIIELHDGRWLAPTATWKGWNGEAPNGMKAIALVSHDHGATWPEYLDILDQYDRGFISWEQSLVQLPDERLLGVAWAYNENSGRTAPTPYVLSHDGQTFSSPQPTGLHGQTTKLHVLSDGRILCVYRRDDQPGLWANVARLDGDAWINVEELLIWGGAESGMAGLGRGADELVDLKFGFPSMVTLPDGEIFTVFWCQEDGVNNIRWYRIRVS